MSPKMHKLDAVCSSCGNEDDGLTPGFCVRCGGTRLIRWNGLSGCKSFSDFRTRAAFDWGKALSTRRLETLRWLEAAWRMTRNYISKTKRVTPAVHSKIVAQLALLLRPNIWGLIQLQSRQQLTRPLQQHALQRHMGFVRNLSSQNRFLMAKDSNMSVWGRHHFCS